MNVYVVWNSEISPSFSSLYLEINSMNDCLYPVDPLICTEGNQVYVVFAFLSISF